MLLTYEKFSLLAIVVVLGVFKTITTSPTELVVISLGMLRC